jgi:dTMP kinase
MARRSRPRGMLITFEGIEGSGKSTQITSLASRLQDAGRLAVIVREPGGTGLGESLRGLLLSYDEEAIDYRAELFLYLAARAQLVAQKIRPALEDGMIVLADRYGDASVAYQGGGRALGLPRVRSLVRFATGGLRPARTYLFDLSARTALARVRSRGAPDRLERERIEFHEAVRRAYLDIARGEPERFRVLRAIEPISRIQERIWRDMVALAGISLAPSRRRT